MLRKDENGQVYLVETMEAPISREDLQNSLEMLVNECAGLQQQLTERQDRINLLQDDLAQFDQLSTPAVETVDNPEPATEAQPNVDELMPEQDAPVEPVVEVAEPFDGGAQAPQDTISVEQAVEQGLNG